jgi:lipid-binding SYLF domain-containing protein
MKRTSLCATLLVATFGLGLTGCKTVPATEEKRQALDTNVQNALDTMRREDPSFGQFLDRAYGYAVYPTVGKGGLLVGGSFGRGEVFEQGRFIGYSDITQATIGAQIGGQAFTEVVAFEDRAALDKFKQNNYAFTAQVTAVAIKSGAAANARFREGVAVFTYIKGGLMAEAAAGGQRFRFQPASDSDRSSSDTRSRETTEVRTREVETRPGGTEIRTREIETRPRDTDAPSR